MSAITVDRAVLEQALEDLKEFGNHYEYCHRYTTWAQPEFQPPCNCGYDNSFTALRDALAQEEQFISLEELAEALGSPDIDSDSEIDKHDMLEMVELQRELLFHAISLNTKIRKRKT